MNVEKDYLLKNGILTHKRPITFAVSHWQSNKNRTSLWYFLYRWIFADLFMIAAISTALWQWYTLRFFGVFLENWNLLLISLEATLGALIATSGFFPSINCLWLYKPYWVLFTIATDFAFLTTPVYWLFHLPMVGVIPLQIIVNAVNIIAVIIDLIVVNHELKILHFFYPLIMGFVYFFFTYLYYILGGVGPLGESYIYYHLNWKSYITCLGTGGLAAAYLVIVHVLLSSACRAKRKCLGSSEKQPLEDKPTADKNIGTEQNVPVFHAKVLVTPNIENTNPEGAGKKANTIFSKEKKIDDPTNLGTNHVAYGYKATVITSDDIGDAPCRKPWVCSKERNAPVVYSNTHFETLKESGSSKSLTDPNEPKDINYRCQASQTDLKDKSKRASCCPAGTNKLDTSDIKHAKEPQKVSTATNLDKEPKKKNWLCLKGKRKSPNPIKERSYPLEKPKTPMLYKTLKPDKTDYSAKISTATNTAPKEDIDKALLSTNKTDLYPNNTPTTQALKVGGSRTPKKRREWCFRTPSTSSHKPDSPDRKHAEKPQKVSAETGPDKETKKRSESCCRTPSTSSHKPDTPDRKHAEKPQKVSAETGPDKETKKRSESCFRTPSTSSHKPDTPDRKHAEKPQKGSAETGPDKETKKRSESCFRTPSTSSHKPDTPDRKHAEKPQKVSAESGPDKETKKRSELCFRTPSTSSSKLDTPEIKHAEKPQKVSTTTGPDKEPKKSRESCFHRPSKGTKAKSLTDPNEPKDKNYRCQASQTSLTDSPSAGFNKLDTSDIKQAKEPKNVSTTTDLDEEPKKILSSRSPSIKSKSGSTTFKIGKYPYKHQIPKTNTPSRYEQYPKRDPSRQISKNSRLGKSNSGSRYLDYESPELTAHLRAHDRLEHMELERMSPKRERSKTSAESLRAKSKSRSKTSTLPSNESIKAKGKGSSQTTGHKNPNSFIQIMPENKKKEYKSNENFKSPYRKKPLNHKSESDIYIPEPPKASILYFCQVPNTSEQSNLPIDFLKIRSTNKNHQSLKINITELENDLHPSKRDRTKADNNHDDPGPRSFLTKFKQLIFGRDNALKPKEPNYLYSGCSDLPIAVSSHELNPSLEIQPAVSPSKGLIYIFEKPKHPFAHNLPDICTSPDETGFATLFANKNNNESALPVKDFSYPVTSDYESSIATIFSITSEKSLAQNVVNIPSIPLDTVHQKQTIPNKENNAEKNKSAEPTCYVSEEITQHKFLNLDTVQYEKETLQGKPQNTLTKGVINPKKSKPSDHINNDFEKIIITPIPSEPQKTLTNQNDVDPTLYVPVKVTQNKFFNLDTVQYQKETHQSKPQKTPKIGVTNAEISKPCEEIRHKDLGKNIVAQNKFNVQCEKDTVHNKPTKYIKQNDHNSEKKKHLGPICDSPEKSTNKTSNYCSSISVEDDIMQKNQIEDVSMKVGICQSAFPKHCSTSTDVNPKTHHRSQKHTKNEESIKMIKNVDKSTLKSMLRINSVPELIDQDSSTEFSEKNV